MLNYYYPYYQGQPCQYQKYPSHFVPNQPLNWYYRFPYPPVDPSLFTQSANETKNLLEDASLVLTKIAESKEFASNVMNAAQKSNSEEVERLIKSTGVQSHVDTTYNPDGMNLTFSSKIEGSDCCKLDIALRWRYL